MYFALTCIYKKQYTLCFYQKQVRMEVTVRMRQAGVVW